MKKMLFVISAILFILTVTPGCSDGYWDETYDPGCGCSQGDPGYPDDNGGYYDNSPYGPYVSGPLAGYPSDQMDIGFYSGPSFVSAQASYGEWTDIKIQCDYYGWEYVGVNSSWEDFYDLDGYWVDGYYEISGYYTYSGKIASVDSFGNEVLVPRDTIWIAQLDTITNTWKHFDVDMESVMALRK